MIRPNPFYDPLDFTSPYYQGGSVATGLTISNTNTSASISPLDDPSLRRIVDHLLVMGFGDQILLRKLDHIAGYLAHYRPSAWEIVTQSYADLGDRKLQFYAEDPEEDE